MASVTVDRLFEVGAHYGKRKSSRHPSMRPFVVGSKARVEIFDLATTTTQIEKAKEALSALSAAGKTVLFVGGKREVADIVKKIAQSIRQPYVASRWLGGTVSNFVEIKKRIDRLADLLHKRESGELAKRYTKLEQLFIDREIERLSTRLDGITELSRRPDAFVIVDTKHEAHATREAKRAGIPVIALMSSDCDVKDATYPIVMNDSSRHAVELVLGALAQAFDAGRKG